MGAPGLHVPQLTRGADLLIRVASPHAVVENPRTVRRPVSSGKLMKPQSAASCGGREGDVANNRELSLSCKRLHGPPNEPIVLTGRPSAFGRNSHTGEGLLFAVRALAVVHGEPPACLRYASLYHPLRIRNAPDAG